MNDHHQALDSISVMVRPILFSGPMVTAIIGGRKTQTRRVVKWKPHEPGYNLSFSGMSVGHHCTGVPASGWVLYSRRGDGCWCERTKPLHCPYGKPGDRLWVRETLGVTSQGDCEYMADGADITDDRRLALCERYGDSYHFSEVKGVPSIFMPRWACRLELDVTNVRIERLQAISEADAIAEGVDAVSLADAPRQATWNRRADYKQLWDSLNSERGYGWKENPWVWVVEFKRAEEARKAA